MVVAHDIRLNSPFKLLGIWIQVEIDILALDAPQKTLDNHIVEPSPLPIHADETPSLHVPFFRAVRAAVRSPYP